MSGYILRRLLVSIPVLFGITMVAFSAVSAAPGDALSARVPPEVLERLSDDQVARIRLELGLDDPLPVRYAKWLRDVLTGDLGYSLSTRQSVSEVIAQRIGPTALLMFTSYLIGSAVGLFVAIVAATHRNRLADRLMTTVASAFVAIPSFVLGLYLIYAFGAGLRLLPTSGMSTPGESGNVVDLARHMILPVTVLSLGFAAPLARYARASILESLELDHVAAVRAKGLPAALIFRRHVLRNALLPIITVVGLSLPDVVAGAVIVETVFGWPGMGQLAVIAATGRDTSLLLGFVLFAGIAVLVSNLLADIGYAIADPRVRYGAD